MRERVTLDKALQYIWIDRSLVIDPVADLRGYLTRSVSLPMMLAPLTRNEAVLSVIREKDRERRVEHGSFEVSRQPVLRLADVGNRVFEDAANNRRVTFDYAKGVITDERFK